MAGGPYITTTYDYNAPLDEYGNLNQPKFGHLKQLHAALKSIEKALVSGNVTTTDLTDSVSVSTLFFLFENFLSFFKTELSFNSIFSMI